MMKLLCRHREVGKNVDGRNSFYNIMHQLKKKLWKDVLNKLLLLLHRRRIAFHRGTCNFSRARNSFLKIQPTTTRGKKIKNIPYYIYKETSLNLVTSATEPEPQFNIESK